MHNKAKKFDSSEQFYIRIVVNSVATLALIDTGIDVKKFFLMFLTFCTPFVVRT